MSPFKRWYGASPWHVVAMVGTFVVAGYAAIRVWPDHKVGITLWFLGAAIGHDLVLLPAYSLLDYLARRPRATPAVPWINHLRVPAFLSGLLLLVWFPLILRLADSYEAASGLTTAPYLNRWLAVSAVFFVVSGAWYGIRRARAHRSA